MDAASRVENDTAHPDPPGGLLACSGWEADWHGPDRRPFALPDEGERPLGRETVVSLTGATYCGK
jgi:hypothetical protein